MIGPLARSAAWILTGAAIAAGLFWIFLNTPESTVFTLAVSGLLAAAIYVVVAVTLAGAVRGWRDSWRTLPLRLAMRGPMVLLPVWLVTLAAWWGVGWGLAWLAAHQGEISAWFIATLDWADVRPLLRAVVIAGEWVRWIAVPFLAVRWLARAVAGPSDGARESGPGRAGTLAQLAVVTAIAAATLWAPVAYGLSWMPIGLPPTWVQPAVALAKFAAMAIVGAIGLSLICRLATGSRSTSSPR